jgi:hypothetical protein
MNGTEAPQLREGLRVVHSAVIESDGPFWVVVCSCGFRSMWGGWNFAQAALEAHGDGEAQR